MSTNKRHSRGGMKPLRQRKKINKGFRRCWWARSWGRLLLGTRDGVDRKTPLAHQMVVEIHDDITVKQVAEPVHRADEDGEPAEVKSEEPAPRPRQGRRFNPLALALCVALIGGGK